MLSNVIESFDPRGVADLRCVVSGERLRLSSRFWAFAVVAFVSPESEALVLSLCRSRGLFLYFPTGEHSEMFVAACPHDNAHYQSAAGFLEDFAPFLDGLAELRLTVEYRPETDLFVKETPDDPLLPPLPEKTMRVQGWRLSPAQQRVVDFLSVYGATLHASRDLSNIGATNGKGYLSVTRSTFLALMRRELLLELPRKPEHSLRLFRLGGM